MPRENQENPVDDVERRRAEALDALRREAGETEESQGLETRQESLEEMNTRIAQEENDKLQMAKAKIEGDLRSEPEGPKKPSVLGNKMEMQDKRLMKSLESSKETEALVRKARETRQEEPKSWLKRLFGG